MQEERGCGAGYAGADYEGFWGCHNAKVSVVEERNGLGRGRGFSSVYTLFFFTIRNTVTRRRLSYKVWTSLDWLARVGCYTGYRIPAAVCWGVHVGWARLIFTLSMLLGCYDSLLWLRLSVLPKIGFRLLVIAISPGLVSTVGYVIGFCAFEQEDFSRHCAYSLGRHASSFVKQKLPEASKHWANAAAEIVGS